MRAAALLLALALAACVKDNGGDREGPSSIRVTIVEGDAGSEDDLLPFSLDGLPFTLSLEAVDTRGRVDTSATGFVRLSVVPGQLEVLGAPEGSVVGNVQLEEGRADDVQVLVSRAFGKSHLWAEDVGFSPAPPGEEAECTNRADDDHDGWWDFPADPGCFYANDDTEEAGSYATGLGQTLLFANPTLADVEGRTTASPLSGAAVTVDIGDRREPSVVVTRLAVDGMYVSDLRYLDDYGHVFAFNYSTPERTRVCDRLARMDGIVSEFFGFTELNFPSWEIVPWEGEPGDGTCPVPEPAAVDSDLAGDALAMEAFEGGLVRLENVKVGRFENCDITGDGLVNRAGPNGCDPECECANDCEADPECTEVVQYQQFGQWKVTLDGGAGSSMFVVSNATVPEFDPSEHSEEIVDFITGTLSSIAFIDPPWILEPRCPADLVPSGDPAPMDEACVTSRTEDPDEN